MSSVLYIRLWHTPKIQKIFIKKKTKKYCKIIKTCGYRMIWESGIIVLGDIAKTKGFPRVN